MPNTDNIQWKRISAEGTAIVVSILLAFSIQAWWDERQNIEDEQVILVALVDEFKEKKSILKIRRVFNQEILESTETLIRASVESDSILTAAELDRHLAILWWYNIEDQWEAPILDTLISGGHLTTISNPELRINLAEWPMAFQLIKRRVGRDEDYFKNVLNPFLAKHASLPQVYLLLPPMPGSNDQNLSEPGWTVSQPSDNTHLLGNQEFVNILTEKVDRHFGILQMSFAGLDEKLDETISMLEAELAD